MGKHRVFRARAVSFTLTGAQDAHCHDGHQPDSSPPQPASGTATRQRKNCGSAGKLKQPDQTLDDSGKSPPHLATGQWHWKRVPHPAASRPALPLKSTNQCDKKRDESWKSVLEAQVPLISDQECRRAREGVVWPLPSRLQCDCGGTYQPYLVI